MIPVFLTRIFFIIAYFSNINLLSLFNSIHFLFLFCTFYYLFLMYKKYYLNKDNKKRIKTNPLGNITGHL